MIGLVRRGRGVPKAVFGVGRSAKRTDAARLRRQFGDRVPQDGPFSVSVPGVVSGWQAMHELGGRLPFGHLLEPAVALAAGGVEVSRSLGRALHALESLDPGLSEVFGPPGRRLREGDVLVQPRLAETLGEIAADPDSYYRGRLARRLVDGLRSAGSPIGLEDLAAQRAVVEDALAGEGGECAPRLFTAGLPSQGVFFAGLASVVATLVSGGYELCGRDASLLARAFCEVSTMRDELLSDPARSPGTGWITERLRELEVSGPAQAPGRVGPAAGGAGPSGDTVAVVCCDTEGNTVSMLQSVFFSFGSRILDPATGVLFHNRQAMFTLRAGAPGELVPGMMPPHTLCPVVVDLPEERRSYVLATMGGRGQPQILSQVLLSLHSGAGAAEACSRPRLLVERTGAEAGRCAAIVEEDLAEDVVSSLVAGGLDVQVVGRHSEEMGHAQLLCVGPEGVYDEGADPRSDGEARRGGSSASGGPARLPPSG